VPDQPESGFPANHGDALDRLTGSVSDGTPVGWRDAETDAGLDPHTLAALRDVARIAEFNRALQENPGGKSPEKPGLTSPVPLERWRDLILLEPIGSGARGEVWRAWDSTLQRQVDVRFLQIEGALDGTGSTDLLGEARALAGVRHPSVVTVFGVAEDRGRVGMWMECLSGVTLAREIERVGALPARQVAWIGHHLCSALQALDAAGLVHRDIKPAGILVEGEKRVVLTDFGSSLRPAPERPSARMGSGAPLHLAPEVLAGQPHTHQSDLYSLGVTLWWALSGRAPLESTTLNELRHEAARGPSLALDALCPRAPRDLIETILHAMKPSCSERAGSAGELAARFRAIVSHLSPPGVSIAVLPFLDRGSGGENEYFSDGLADELIGMLAKIRGLRVAARTSAFRFRGRQVTIGDIGRALHVDTVMDGSITRSGDRIRISVQLVQVSDGLHLWSETYDRTVEDVFAVQENIAESVVRELRGALLGIGEDPVREANAAVAEAVRGRSTNAAAHRLYLLGRYFVNRLNREDLSRAMEHLKEAVALDPKFALAWAELGGAYTRAATYGLLAKTEAITLARNAARRSLAIEPDLAEAHARLGAIQMFHDWDWKGAEASYARALELAPGDSVALNGAGVLAVVLGRLEESIRLCRQASEQDPLSASPHYNLGLNLLHAGRFPEAESILRKALELAPQRFLTRGVLGIALAHQGRGEEALAEAEREPDEGYRLFAEALVHHVLGNRGESDASLRALIEGFEKDYAVQIAEVQAARGDADAAFAWLERGYAARDFGVTELRIHPAFQPFHGDPRWSSMLARLGLEAEPAG
jgi:TolB-like protein/Tfp pilus assembly protein PilF